MDIFDELFNQFDPKKKSSTIQKEQEKPQTKKTIESQQKIQINIFDELDQEINETNSYIPTFVQKKESNAQDLKEKRASLFGLSSQQQINNPTKTSFDNTQQMKKSITSQKNDLFDDISLKNNNNNDEIDTINLGASRRGRSVTQKTSKHEITSPKSRFCTENDDFSSQANIQRTKSSNVEINTLKPPKLMKSPDKKDENIFHLINYNKEKDEENSPFVVERRSTVNRPQSNTTSANVSGFSLIKQQKQHEQQQSKRISQYQDQRISIHGQPLSVVESTSLDDQQRNKNFGNTSEIKQYMGNNNENNYQIEQIKKNYETQIALLKENYESQLSHERKLRQTLNEEFIQILKTEKERIQELYKSEMNVREQHFLKEKQALQNTFESAQNVLKQQLEQQIRVNTIVQDIKENREKILMMENKIDERTGIFKEEKIQELQNRENRIKEQEKLIKSQLEFLEREKERLEKQFDEMDKKEIESKKEIENERNSLKKEYERLTDFQQQIKQQERQYKKEIMQQFQLQQISLNNYEQEKLQLKQEYEDKYKLLENQILIYEKNKINQQESNQKLETFYKLKLKELENNKLQLIEKEQILYQKQKAIELKELEITSIQTELRQLQHKQQLQVKQNEQENKNLENLYQKIQIESKNINDFKLSFHNQTAEIKKQQFEISQKEQRLAQEKLQIQEQQMKLSQMEKNIQYLKTETIKETFQQPKIKNYTQIYQNQQTIEIKKERSSSLFNFEKENQQKNKQINKINNINNFMGTKTFNLNEFMNELKQIDRNNTINQIYINKEKDNLFVKKQLNINQISFQHNLQQRGNRSQSQYNNYCQDYGANQQQSETHTHECSQHELNAYYEKIYEENYKNIPPQTNQRNLQSSSIQAQPIRVTIDYSTIDRVGAGITQQQKQYLIRIMEVAKLYLQKLLKVYPTQGRNMFSRSWGQSCIDINVPQQDLQNGIADSDLHIYVVYVNTMSKGYLANAGYCSISDTYRRPNYGRVNFNIARMGPYSGDSEQFENNLETTIHEIIHVLGFTGGALKFWIDPQTNQPYGNNVGKIAKTKSVRGKQATILYSKNVLETTRKYYNCPTADGMQLENDNGSGGSFGSHWEKTVINNELMSPSASLTDAQLSVFTIALLKDTGFYAEVNENMSDSIYWGKGKGCEFLNNACYSKQQFPEFPGNSQAQQCTFEYEGIGIGNTDKFSDNCLTVRPYSNRLCTDPKNKYDSGTKSRLEYFGYDSKCFYSTATDGSMMAMYQFRCHKFKCSDDKQQISIILTQIDKEVTCSISQQGQAVYIDPNNKSYGQIACPNDINRFCNNTPICPNFCSENGICVKGQCICNPGYGNIDCSLQCKTSLVQNNQCVTQCSQGNFINPDNTCKNSCPPSYFGKNGRCEPCHSSCSSCTDEKPTSCLSCQYLTFLQSGTCVSQCNTAQGYILNNNGECVNNSIPNCKVQNCKLCENQNNQKCIQCSPNYYLISTFQCIQQCPDSQFGDTQSGKCLDCSLYLDDCTKCTNSTTCTQCNSNKILQNGKCKDSTPTPQCQKNCSECINSQKCIKCSTGYFLDYTYSCVQQCYQGQFPSFESQMCENCNIYLESCVLCKSKDECTVCEKGKVLQNGKCIDPSLKCFQNCDSCENLNKCTKCSNGYFLDYKLQCVLQCYQGQFANLTTQWCENCNLYIPNCLQCSNSKQCTQCDDGKQLFQGKCVDINNGCSANCQTCEDINKCTKCSSGFFLDYQLKCVQQCYPGQFANPTSQWCENCNLYISGCQLCSNQSQCTQCESGKQLSQGKCIDINNGCPANCQTCENATKCQKCSSGYFLDYQLKCVTQCYPGQFPNPTSQWCENCNIYIEGCVECTSQSKCSKCDNTKGFVLNGTTCAKGRSLKEIIQKRAL